MNATLPLPARAAPFVQSTLLLLLRLLFGGLFAETGWGKLANLERTAAFFESLSLPAPGVMAALAGGTELLGGLLLLVGLGTRFAALALSGVMITALVTAHAPEAFASPADFLAQAPAPYLVASLILFAFGGGRVALDARLFSGLERGGA